MVVLHVEVNTFLQGIESVLISNETSYAPVICLSCHYTKRHVYSLDRLRLLWLFLLWFLLLRLFFLRLFFLRFWMIVSPGVIVNGSIRKECVNINDILEEAPLRTGLCLLYRLLTNGRFLIDVES